jgi:hypothetical protein
MFDSLVQIHSDFLFLSVLQFVNLECKSFCLEDEKWESELLI